MRGRLARSKKDAPPTAPSPRQSRAAPGSAVFLGDLSQFGLVDIAQTMMTGRKTGLLTVRTGRRAGYVYFLDGQIAYVMDDQFLQGLQAALQIFLWKEGSFEFDFSQAPPGQNINVSTENLLFEVARQIDEVQRLDRTGRRHGKQRGTLAHSLQERHMEQIRDVFAKIARRVMPEIRGGGRIAPRGSSVEVWLKRLTPATGESIFLVPGLKPKLKTGGTVRNLDGPGVDPEAIERFVRSNLDRGQREILQAERSLEILVEVGDAAPARLQITGEGRKKMIVVHLLHKVPNLFSGLEERLGSPPPFVRDLLEMDGGLVLIAGGPSSGKSRVMASLIRLRAESRGSLVFLLARSREFLFENTSGLVLQKSLPKGSIEFAETLRVCLAQSPDLIALDGLGGPGVMEPIFRAASTGRAILGCLEADDPRDALRQASEFMERRKDAITRKLFRDNLRAILFLERLAPAPEGLLGYRILDLEIRRERDRDRCDTGDPAGGGLAARSVLEI